MRARIALVVCAVALALVAVEVGLRLAGADLNPNPQLRFHPRLGWTLQPDWPRLDEVTPQGFRYRPAVERTGPRRRLLVLGDSFSVAGQYPYAATYPGLLEARLNARDAATGETWEVVNLSVSGWGTGQQLLALERYGLALEPDAVVLQSFPNNDLCNNTLELAFTCSFLDFHRPYFALDGERLRLTWVDPLRARARAASRLFGLAEVRLGWGLETEDPELAPKERKALRYRTRRMRVREAGLEFSSSLYALVPEAHQPPVVRESWRVTERLLTEIAELCRERKIPLVALVVPFADSFDPRWLESQRAGARHLVAGYDTARFETVLRAHGARVISMREAILAGAEPWRWYFFPRGRSDRHFSDNGHRRAAEWILEALGAQS